MIVKNLKNIPFKEIMTCFHQSFENYFVPFPKENYFWQKRWQLAKVDFNLSYGMFHNNKLVGFIINAIDYRNGKLTAFNTGTGVLPAYRGKKIVKSIYDYAKKELQKNGITICTLEVIQENAIAIKTYKSIGFKITKTYKCYAGKINITNKKKIVLNKINFETFNSLTLPNQELYSWDNHKNVIINGNYNYYKIMKNNILESYFVINPENRYLAQFDVLINKMSVWKDLFSGISQISEKIKINNIDNTFAEKIVFVEKIGLQNTVNQFEMKLK